MGRMRYADPPPATGHAWEDAHARLVRVSVLKVAAHAADLASRLGILGRILATHELDVWLSEATAVREWAFGQMAVLGLTRRDLEEARRSP